ncbi:hypothetical protein OS493_026889 [Desmophyllum pertusum]|uniref:Uncharacterized protein n=1 Tax=Desmophyllum pertusum TaxID=174260 RepID=A0A9W9ZBY9_9CNID|nr:hypothetical protein OS493_026889 [Desmophyllum pertusum]
MINRTKSVDGGHLSKGARPKFAESTVNNLVPVVEKCDIASFQRTGSLNQDGTSTPNGQSLSSDRDKRTDLLTNPSASDKRRLFRHEGVRSKSLFDMEGSIDFCENGDIDLK